MTTVVTKPAWLLRKEAVVTQPVVVTPVVTRNQLVSPAQSNREIFEAVKAGMKRVSEDPFYTPEVMALASERINAALDRNRDRHKGSRAAYMREYRKRAKHNAPD